jgi:hypothetical protein
MGRAKLLKPLNPDDCIFHLGDSVQYKDREIFFISMKVITIGLDGKSVKVNATKKGHKRKIEIWVSVNNLERINIR